MQQLMVAKQLLFACLYSFHHKHGFNIKKLCLTAIAKAVLFHFWSISGVVVFVFVFVCAVLIASLKSCS